MALQDKTLATGVLDILSVDGGIDASTARNVADGDGTASPLYLTTTKVGIGESSPDNILHLKSATAYEGIKIENSLTSGGRGTSMLMVDGNGDGWKISQQGHTTGQYLNFLSVDNNSDETNPVLTMLDGGKIGIGDTAPDGCLTINQGSADDMVLSFKSSDVAHGMTDIEETDTFGRFKKMGGAQGGLFITGLAETGTNTGIRLSGYVSQETGDRDTSAGGAVLINGATKSSATVGNMSADKNIIIIRNNATTRFIFDSDGDLHSDSSNTTFSDSRLKSSVEDIPYGLAEILQLQPKRFDKESGYFDESGNVVLEGNKRKMIGFMAQDVKSVIPEMVKDVDESSSFYSMEYGKLVSVLVKAIQELSAKVTALENA